MSTDLLTRPTMRTIVKAMTARDLAVCAQDVISWQDSVCSRRWLASSAGGPFRGRDGHR